MKLTYEQIKSVSYGVAYTEERDGAVYFHRFTEEQEQAYALRSADFYKKTKATAGVSLTFKTNSRTLGFEATVSPAASRRFYGFDLMVDGVCTHSHKGEVPADVESESVACRFALCEGEKTVKLVLPWSAQVALHSLTLDDGAVLAPIAPTKEMLLFGDSITQGYDASVPHASYASRICEALGVNARNKAIGGEFFWGELSLMKDDNEPSLITVAYGTNDWSRVKREAFDESARAFYENLAKTYPNAAIYAITPIWRADWENKEKDYPFFHVAEHIEEIAKGIPNMTVIRGFDFVPEDTALFSDKYLHPNDEGFAYYAASLLCKLKELGV